MRRRYPDALASSELLCAELVELELHLLGLTDGLLHLLDDLVEPLALLDLRGSLFLKLLHSLIEVIDPGVPAEHLALETEVDVACVKLLTVFIDYGDIHDYGIGQSDA